MHTFFINASGQKIENYSDILEIQHETRKLVSLECPIENWFSDTEGYKACVNKMGELIDTYKEINNSFNLIIYVDLIAVETYRNIPMTEHLQRYACLEAMYSLFKHYINNTIIEELKNCGRTPNEVLIIFEENQKPGDKNEITESGRMAKQDYVKALLGLPEDKAFYEFISDFEKNNAESNAEALCNKLNETFTDSALQNLILTYVDIADTFLGELRESGSLERSAQKMYDRILEGSTSDRETVNAVSFVTDRKADVANKREIARRDLRLSFYILNCVKGETVFTCAADGEERTVTSVKEFPEIDWDKAADSIIEKSMIFRKQYRITTTLSESFSKLELAPVLYAFDNEKFALDEYGKPAHTFEVVDVKEEKNDKTDPNNKKEKNKLLGSVEKKAVVVNDVYAESMFTENEFKLFDYNGKSYEENISAGKPVAETYITEARKLREHHIEYLKRLKLHVTEVLSNYAGRSDENEPALLKKRSVAASDHDIDSKHDKCNYSQPEQNEETKKLDVVKEVSKNAYESALLAYMEFCAGRSVTVTDIENQCNWFITRVYQIEESLKKLKKIAVGLLAAFVFMYMPFLIIQWDVITKNLVSGLVAIVSLAVPLAILYGTFIISAEKQKKKYAKEWKVFKAKADEALKENSIAAQKYDKLLSVFIPALRWLYEYKLDVDFYADCCKMARAKVNHHKQKLNERITAIKNIIDDLEIDEEKLESMHKKAYATSDDTVIDYNASFCSGETNRNFYSFGTGDSVFDA